MITQAEYARHAGLTKGRVSQLVKAGMPLTSLDEADAWRGMTAQKRPPARRAEQGAHAASPAGAPAEPVRPADAEAPPVGGVNEDTPAGAYERQRQIERAAFVLAVRALKAKQPDAARLVAIHASAAANLTRARAAVLELEERERRLVSADWVRRIMTEHDGALVTLLKAMPRILAPRISPHDPEHAEEQLSKWVQDDLLKVLYGTNPWAAAETKAGT